MRCRIITALRGRGTKRGILNLRVVPFVFLTAIALKYVLLADTSSGESVGTDEIKKSSSLSKDFLSPPIDLGRKDGTRVILNIGSNLDPIVPRPNDNPCTIALTFEPIVGHRIPQHPALHVIPAAVTGSSGWSTMNIYNRDGRSSSLSKASYKDGWNNHSQLKVVPTIGLRLILESLRNFEIDFILTDMQGHDFAAVSSVGDFLAKAGVKRLVTEVYRDQVFTYQGVQNDLCQDWLPHMTNIGYVFEGLTEMSGDTEGLIDGYRNAEEIVGSCKIAASKTDKTPKAGLSEYNAFWRLQSEPAIGEGIDAYQYGTHSERQPGHSFTEADYKKCI